MERVGWSMLGWEGGSSGIMWAIFLITGSEWRRDYAPWVNLLGSTRASRIGESSGFFWLMLFIFLLNPSLWKG